MRNEFERGTFMYGVIIRAIEHQHLVQLIYLDAKQKITQRNVQPTEISGTHLKAFCFLRKQIRLFRLDCILAVAPINHNQKFDELG